GDQILRPENTFIVIETCSGVRTIVTLAMLTVLLIDLFDRRGWHAFALLMFSPVIAFLTNGLRVVTLVLNPHSSIHSIHNLQGIVMLLVGLTAIYFLDSLIERFVDDREEATASSGRAFALVAIPDSWGRLLRLGAVVAVLGVMLATSHAAQPWKVPSGLDRMPDDLLVSVFGARSRPVEPDYQFRGSARFLAHASRVVRVEGERVEVFLGVGNEQIRSHTILTPRLAWPRSGLERVDESSISIGEGEEQVEVRRVILTDGVRRVVSYSWYLRAGSLAEEWMRNAAALDRSPFVRDQHMLAIRLSAPFGRGGPPIEQAERAIRKAWQRLAPELKGYAPSTSD
ncbi:MAG: exosortase-associated EpsI family protein, partial [Gemmatimonadetes bacterium]|nr:exosortase-associated EpsI family protein [Gemmatimonadota bacterium]